MDVHRSFAQVAICADDRMQSGGRVAMQRDALLSFGAEKLQRTDEVVLEATGNTMAIVRLLRPFVHRVVIANQIQVRAIAWAKVKTDKIDAAMLAKLYAAGYLPEVWIPDEETECLRRVVAERAQLVRHRTRLKNQIQSVLHANLILAYPGGLFSRKGRAWLKEQPLPADQRRSIDRHLTEFDRTSKDLHDIEVELSRTAIKDKQVRRMMTIGGVNAVVATSMLAAIGDISRFATPEKLVSYLGVNPRVRQSGNRPAYHGRITKQGRSQARAMLVEAAWAISRQPGPLHAFFHRIKAKKGNQIAATATARKLVVVVWHLLTKEEDYAWTRPALYAWKIRKLELAAGLPSERGGHKKGVAAEYHLRESRNRERQWIGMVEEEYKRLVEGWRDAPPNPA